MYVVVNYFIKVVVIVYMQNESQQLLHNQMCVSNIMRVVTLCVVNSLLSEVHHARHHVHVQAVIQA